jgi:ATP adenylyltransferase
MKRLWAPWRMEYIKSPPPDRCVFCREPEADPQERLILYSDDLIGVMLNRYPYSNGHLLIYPLKHTQTIEALSLEEGSRLFALIQVSTTILREAMAPEGFNIGMNVGKVAGAGIDDHIHLHVVPRWPGDANFMPILADVKVMPEHLEESYKTLSLPFQKITLT